jgi:hypothetical protein
MDEPLRTVAVFNPDDADDAKYPGQSYEKRYGLRVLKYQQNPVLCWVEFIGTVKDLRRMMTDHYGEDVADLEIYYPNIFYKA